jgi:heme/copper-type cytochrome/quinol oxidase subunit 3
MGRHASGWWGMIMLIATEGALFGYLLFAYYYLAVQHGRDWLPPVLPGWAWSIPETVVLLVSAGVVWLAERRLARDGGDLLLVVMLLVAALLGVAFLVLEVFDWASESFTPYTNAFGSLFFAITGIHFLHLFVGVLILFVLALWAALGYFDRRRTAILMTGALYWYFVSLSWLAFFFTLYSPRLSVG